MALEWPEKGLRRASLAGDAKLYKEYQVADVPSIKETFLKWFPVDGETT